MRRQQRASCRISVKNNKEVKLGWKELIANESPPPPDYHTADDIAIMTGRSDQMVRRSMARARKTGTVICMRYKDVWYYKE
jgi:hypothetical protein